MDGQMTWVRLDPEGTEEGKGMNSLEMTRRSTKFLLYIWTQWSEDWGVENSHHMSVLQEQRCPQGDGAKL